MHVTHEFAIVGAGIAGASLAYRLAEHAGVILLEREAQPGYHATGRSAAMFMETYGTPTIQALTRAGREFYEHPPAVFGDDPILTPRGVLYVATREQGSLLDDAYGIGTSQEFQTVLWQRGAQAVVYNLYNVWLFREPDTQGYWGWVDNFNNARRPQDLGNLLRSFVGSQEFYQKNVAPWGY